VTWKRACSAAELVVNTPLGVVVDQVAVCLVRIGAEVFAVHDECTHESVRLSEGNVDDGVIECWRHGSCFDLRTGAALNLPALRAVVVYPVRETMDEVQVDLEGHLM
jgi:3-phenylpropionate/trans-cinnamate dioxygenase ferredoxin subunit